MKSFYPSLGIVGSPGIQIFVSMGSFNYTIGYQTIKISEREFRKAYSQWTSRACTFPDKNCILLYSLCAVGTSRSHLSLHQFYFKLIMFTNQVNPEHSVATNFDTELKVITLSERSSCWQSKTRRCNFSSDELIFHLNGSMAEYILFP